MTEDSAQPTEPAPPRAGLRTLDWTRAAVALLGVLLSGFLLFESLTTTALPGCGGGSACDKVLSSAWSLWLGVPVALPALAVWTLALVAAVTKQRGLLIVASLVLGGAAVWFVYVQVARLGELCPYCIAAHTLAIVMLFVAMVGVEHVPLKQLAVAMPVVFVLILGQLAFPSRVVQHRILKHAGIEVPVSEYPILGNPQADHIALLLYDYTCPHCRTLHGYLKRAIDRYDGQFAVALSPAPLDADCNPHLTETEPIHEQGCELAGALLAVWLADRDAASAMDHYLAETGPADDWAGYEQRAVELVSAAAFERTRNDERVSAFLKAGCDVNRAVGRSAGVGDRLPKLVLGTTGHDVIVGRPGTAEQLFADLEAMLGLTPVESATQ